MVRRSLDRDSPSGRLVDRFLAAADELDPRAMHSVLHHAHHELGIETALDDVLFPSMRLVGWWWQTGRCDVAQEHLATQAAREWLASLIVEADPPTQPRPAILACGPASQHTLGLEALAVLLTLRGWPCRTLGGRTPTRALVTAATASHAAHVVIVAHMTLNRRAAVVSIHAVADVDVRVYYAGSAFTRPADRRALPGTYLGESLARAASTIDAARAG